MLRQDKIAEDEMLSKLRMLHIYSRVGVDWRALTGRHNLELDQRYYSTMETRDNAMPRGVVARAIIQCSERMRPVNQSAAMAMVEKKGP